MSVVVVRGDATRLPLPDESIDLIVTSPPYFALRSYQDAGEHYAGQLGDEPTVAEYLDALLDATAEWQRVLRPTGSMFVNLGDKYGRGDRTIVEQGGGKNGRGRPRDVPATGSPKSLLGVPWRYALRCTDELGLTLRAEIVWAKPNGLPESVRDRVVRSHETWFHLTKSLRYYSAIDEIREPHAPGTAARYATGYGDRSRTNEQRPSVGYDLGGTWTLPELGRAPGSVWSIASEPLRVPPELELDHFAAFPVEWPLRLIRGWSPPAVCLACDEGRRPISERSTVFDKARDQDHAAEIAARGAAHGVMSGGTARSTLNGRTSRAIVGYACGCPDAAAPTRPAVVLDPMGGSGTTALAAHVLGRVGITVDLSHDYCRLAAWRTTDPGELARARRVPKPDPLPAGQESLW